MTQQVSPEAGKRQQSADVEIEAAGVYITKKDILDIMRYEETWGQRYHSVVPDDYLREMPVDEGIPVLEAFVRNNHHIRCVASMIDGQSLYIDMPFHIFYGLQRTEGHG